MQASLRAFGFGLVSLTLAIGCGSSSSSSKDGAAGSSGSAGKGGNGGSGGMSPDGGHDAQRDVFALDLGGVTPPATITATVVDRRETLFELVWTAPSIGGDAVTGYEVRYAKVPITATNFDDATVTTAIPFTGTPKAPGDADGMTVKLYIETGYYFAVEGTNAAGTRSAIDASTTAVAAHFMVTTLTGASGDRMGGDVDGTGDFGKPSGSSFTGDGLSDLIVGAGNGERHVYLFFGSTSGYSTTPAVTFTGSVNGFGTGVANAGDLDGDGLDDIAISSAADGSGKVYIFSRKNPPVSWGTTTSWPAALSDTQANYVITLNPATFAAGVMDFRCLARLGNFNGTGTDDLAIGLDGANSATGAVFIVEGSSTFASRTLPDPANAIEIDGVASSGFGYQTIGIGNFFQSASGDLGLLTSTFLTSAAYAFAGQAPTGVLTAAMANDSIIGTTADRYGRSLGFLGALGASPGAVAIGATVGGYVDVHLGTASTGPLLGPAGGAPAPSVRLIDSASTDSFSLVDIGGGVKGTTSVASVIGGDSVPDLIVAGNEPSFPIYIVSGASIATLSGMIDVSNPPAAASSAVVKVVGGIPSDRSGYGGSSIIPDSNGDGYADFVIGEATTSPNPGRVFVFY